MRILPKRTARADLLQYVELLLTTMLLSMLLLSKERGACRKDGWERRSEDQDSVLDDDDEVMELLKRKVAGPALARLLYLLIDVLSEIT